MGTISLAIPQTGLPNSTEDVKISSDFTTVQTVINGNLDPTNLTPGTAARLTDIYQTIADSTILIAASTAPGLYPFLKYTSTQNGGAALINPDFFYFDPARFLPAGDTRAVMYEVVAYLTTNNVAPGSTFSVTLYPIVAFTGAGPAPTLGTAVTGSLAGFPAPSTDVASGPVFSGDFAAPVAGFYVMVVSCPSGTAASSSTAIRAQLQMRRV